MVHRKQVQRLFIDLKIPVRNTKNAIMFSIPERFFQFIRN
ncbi:tRNA lysidine(34) synthetase TilS [Streptococcus infantis]|nr:tRNA lysidine(34) synthetase TilS [Streptococcus infantis]